MRCVHWWESLAIGVTLIACALGTHAGGAEPRKYALLVAVTTYSHHEFNKPEPLQFPQADAEALAKVLVASDYEVDLLLGVDASLEAVRAKLSGLPAKGNESGVVIVGFWGHGVEFEHTNEAMFCPYDAKLELVNDPSGAQRTAAEQGRSVVPEPDPESLLGMEEVLIALKACGAGNRLLLADCCRNSPYRPSGRAFGDRLTTSDLPSNTVALFACSRGERAFEHASWGHGAFTKCLLDLMPTIAKEQRDVERYTGELKENVALLVRQTSRGRENQTVFKLSTGNPTLLLNPEKPAGPGESRSTGIRFVRIDTGEGIMGSTETDPYHETDETAHPSPIKHPFHIATTEVSQRQFEQVMGFNPSRFRDSPEGPVESITWYDAISFCNRLSVADGLEPVYAIDRPIVSGDHLVSASVHWREGPDGYRLPTEAEWEYACRAGTQGLFALDDPSSDSMNFDGTFPLRGASRGIYRAKTVAVTELSANPWGLHHVHGNVSEWCWDPYGELSLEQEKALDNASARDANGDPIDRVHRGGAWNSMAKACRSAKRLRADPSITQPTIGFRIVR